MLDLLVAAYLPAIEHLDEAIDDAQDEVFDRPSPRTLQVDLPDQALGAAAAPHPRPGAGGHQPSGPRRLRPDPTEHRVYFRDIYDHLVRVHDITEGLRDLISGALDTYLSAISNRTNDIMKTLTIVTVMFLPMSFLTAFFGMNFFGDTLTFHAADAQGLALHSDLPDRASHPAVDLGLGAAAAMVLIGGGSKREWGRR